MKILFICHANLCRSFMAQEFLKQLLPSATVFSRGLYVDPELSVPQKIKDFLALYHIPFVSHTPTQLCENDLQAADYVFCMEPEHLNSLLDKYAQYTDKLWLLNEFAFGKHTALEDPISLSGRAFTKQAEQLKKAVENCAKRLASEKQAQNQYNKINLP